MSPLLSHRRAATGFKKIHFGLYRTGEEWFVPEEQLIFSVPENLTLQDLKNWLLEKRLVEETGAGRNSAGFLRYFRLAPAQLRERSRDLLAKTGISAHLA